MAFNPIPYIRTSIAAQNPVRQELAPAIAAAPAKAWYENPWYLGIGAALVLGGVWFATRK